MQGPEVTGHNDELAPLGLGTPPFPEFSDKSRARGSPPSELACLLVLGQPRHSTVLVRPLSLVRGILRQRHINLGLKFITKVTVLKDTVGEMSSQRTGSCPCNFENLLCVQPLQSPEKSLKRE